eukprot:1139715-Pelagomonas_calceolata.AAC.7
MMSATLMGNTRDKPAEIEPYFFPLLVKETHGSLSLFDLFLHDEGSIQLSYKPFPLILVSQGEKKEHNAGTSTAPTPNPKITYLPNLQNALTSHMHTKHRLGNANSKAGFFSHYQ